MPRKRVCQFALSIALLLTAPLPPWAMSFGSTLCPTASDPNGLLTSFAEAKLSASSLFAQSYTTIQATQGQNAFGGVLTSGPVGFMPDITLTPSGGAPLTRYGGLSASGTLSHPWQMTNLASLANSNYAVQVGDAAGIRTSSIGIPGMTGPTPPPQASGYTLAWSEDFSSLRVSPGANDAGYTWYPGIWHDPKLPPASNITNPSGVLDLAWTSGQTGQPTETQMATISHDGTTSAQTFRYGYFEARLRWDVTTGAWPGFWMLPKQELSGTTDHGEIDIFRGQGASPHTYHASVSEWNGSTLVFQSSPSAFDLPAHNDFSQWHTYGMLWKPGTVTWYYDNVAVGTASIPAVVDSQDFYLLLSMYEGAGFHEGDLTGVTANSMHLQVDWVRVWQNGTGDSPVTNPPTITAFGASPSTITAGGSSSLHWTVLNATSLSVSGIGTVTGTSVSASPTVTTTYTLTASNANGSVTATTTISVTSASPGITPPPQAGSFVTLAFQDEFDTLNVSPDANSPGYVWYPGIWYSSSLPNPGLITSPSGVVDLAWSRSATSSPAETQIMTISHNGTTTARTWRHGYFEARMKWDPVVGAWPAFWLNPIQEVRGQATQHGEIDIFEGQGSDPHTYYGTLHDWSGSTHLGATSPNAFNLAANNDFSQWHTYGLLWTPGHVTWYYDNVAVGSANTYADMESQDFYLLLSMNFGNNWSEGNLSGVTVNSAHLQVDWVRVWQ